MKIKLCIISLLLLLALLTPCFAEENASPAPEAPPEAAEPVEPDIPEETEPPLETEPTFTLPRDENSETADGIIFTSENGEVTIIGYTGYETELIVPSVILDKTVTAIAPEAFAENHELISLTLPESVTVIGEAAFEGCTMLEKIILPQGVCEIPARMLRGCHSLEGLTLPAGVTSIGDLAFEGCYSLGRLKLPDSVASIGVDAFMGCEKIYLEIGTSEAALEYAERYNIPDSFGDTFIFRMIIMAVITAVLGVGVIFGWRYLDGRKKP